MERQLLKSIVRYLKRKSSDGSLDEDLSASIEVACECIQSAFTISPEEVLLCEKATLEEVFEAGARVLNYDEIKVTDADHALAETHKETGNEHMRAGRHVEAVDWYSRAIQVNPGVCTYHSNRSAAYYKLGQFKEALADGRRAVELSPDYAQAYGRVGSASLALKMHADAVAAFEMAVKLDDSKAAFRENLELSRRELLASGDQSPNLTDMLGNPEIMRLASQLMSNTNVQSMVGDLMGGQSSPDMASLMEMGQQFAQQLRQSNPEVMEQIQNAFRPPPSGDDNH